ncbi:MAG: hypothetical protein ACK4P2_08140 [Hyphomonas sp.]
MLTIAGPGQVPRPNPDPVATLKTAISLRAGSLAAFPAGAVLMAILERGWLSIAALAAAMLAVSLFERRRFGKALGIAIPSNSGTLMTGLAVRFGLLTGLFVVTLGVLALFRDTALSRGLGWTDLAVIGLSAGGALLANGISARLAPVRTQPGQAPPESAPAGSVILEGEIIDHDPR